MCDLPPKNANQKKLKIWKLFFSKFCVKTFLYLTTRSNPDISNWLHMHENNSAKIHSLKFKNHSDENMLGPEHMIFNLFSWNKNQFLNEIFCIVYIIKQDTHLYVVYSRPNGWADIFCEKSWVAGMSYRLKLVFLHGQRQAL